MENKSQCLLRGPKCSKKHSFHSRETSSGMLKDTWSVPRERPPKAKGILGGDLMKGRVHMLASAFSAFPKAHFLPWEWCGPNVPRCFAKFPSLSFPGKFAIYILVFARIQETCTQVPDLSHSHCVTFGDSLRTSPGLLVLMYLIQEQMKQYYNYQSKCIYWMHSMDLLFI